MFVSVLFLYLTVGGRSAVPVAVNVVLRWAAQLVVQEYTDDTAELRRQLDALGGMAALQQPELQLQAIMELEQAVSAVREKGAVLGFWQLRLRSGGTCAPAPWRAAAR